MNLVRAFVLVGWAVVAVALPGHSESVKSKGQPMLAELGITLFRDHCASCHGSLGRGDGPAATALKVPPADLTQIATRNGGAFPDAEVASFIDGRFELDAHGTREMPIWGRRLAEPIAGGTGDEVARGQIQILIEYLKTIQQPAR